MKSTIIWLGFLDLRAHPRKKQSNQGKFLSEMEVVVLWQALIDFIEPHHPQNQQEKCPAPAKSWPRSACGVGASLCGVSPLPASWGKTSRYRFNRGGNRKANAMQHRIIWATRLKKACRGRESPRMESNYPCLQDLACPNLLNKKAHKVSNKRVRL